MANATVREQKNLPIESLGAPPEGSVGTYLMKKIGTPQTNEWLTAIYVDADITPIAIGGPATVPVVLIDVSAGVTDQDLVNAIAVAQTAGVIGGGGGIPPVVVKKP